MKNTCNIININMLKYNYYKYRNYIKYFSIRVNPPNPRKSVFNSFFIKSVCVSCCAVLQ